MKSDKTGEPQAEHAAANYSSPLVGDERESLVKEIVAEIRKDSVKQDALTRLKSGWPALVSKFFQHPATLLVVGFALTGLIGGLLTSRLQSKEWDRQQRRLITIKEIDTKYKLLDDLTQAVGARNAAVTSIVTPIAESEGDELAAALKMPLNAWETAVYNWRVSTQTLRPKVERLNDPTAAQNFKEITNRGRIINLTVVELRGRLRVAGVPRDDEKVADLVDKVNDAVEETGAYLKRLSDSIVAEARADAEVPGP